MLSDDLKAEHATKHSAVLLSRSVITRQTRKQVASDPLPSIRFLSFDFNVFGANVSARRSTSGSASSNDTPFVDEKARGPAVDDNVVLQRNKEPQISTDFNLPSGMALAGKHLKTDLLCYSDG